MTDPLIARAIEAQERQRRYGRIEALLAGVIIAILIVAVLVFTVFIPRQAHVESNSDRSICIALLQADFDSAITDALAAPPAPSTARADAVARLQAAARRLHHVRTIC